MTLKDLPIVTIRCLTISEVEWLDVAVRILGPGNIDGEHLRGRFKVALDEAKLRGRVTAGMIDLALEERGERNAEETEDIQVPTSEVSGVEGEVQGSDGREETQGGGTRGGVAQERPESEPKPHKGDGEGGEQEEEEEHS